MESRRQNYNIEDLIEKMDEKGKLTFDYPIQRECCHRMSTRKTITDLLDNAMEIRTLPLKP